MTDEKEKPAAWAKNTAGALIQSYEAYERGLEEDMVLGTP
jgi:hypothetical protein